MILNFWATWCAPCKREMPSLEKLTNQFPQVKVYAINMEKPNKLYAMDFFKSIGVTSLDIYFDPDFKLVKQFKMRGLPTSILIDKNGKEFGRVVGEINSYYTISSKVNPAHCPPKIFSIRSTHPHVIGAAISKTPNHMTLLGVCPCDDVMVGTFTKTNAARNGYPIADAGLCG
mgnify:CR=1 FL=1